MKALQSSTYRSAFFKLITEVISLHDWISQSEMRKKWAFRIAIILLYLEITIHISGIGHFEEAKDWWKNMPIVNSVIEFA